MTTCPGVFWIAITVPATLAERVSEPTRATGSSAVTVSPAFTYTSARIPSASGPMEMVGAMTCDLSIETCEESDFHTKSAPSSNTITIMPVRVCTHGCAKIDFFSDCSIKVIL